MEKMAYRGIGGKCGPSVFSLVAAAFVLCGTAFGVNTNRWISGATDWNSETSYEEVCVPEPGDVVVIPSGVTATVSVVSTEAANAEGSSFGVFSKLSRVLTEDATSALVLDIAEGASVTNLCYIHGLNAKGTIIKRGPGMIEFGANDYAYAYNLHIHVQQGVLVLPQDLPLGNFFIGNLRVDEGAALITAMNEERKGELSSSPTQCYEITGEGAISNRYEKNQRLDFRDDGRRFTFGGILGKGLRLFPHAKVELMLTGTNSTVAYNVELSAGATIGVKKMGMSGKTSSLGSNGIISLRGSSGKLLYLGEGETSDKSIRTFSNQNVEHVLDGGAHGGLILTGAFGYMSSDDGWGMQRVTITGSNAVPCEIRGAIGSKSVNGTNYYWHLTKKGTGTWRLGDYERTYPNAWTVEDGTLQFESMKNAGTACSLGVSTNLFKSYSGLIDESKRVDWAFGLGSAAARGTMEYVGGTDVSCTSRLAAVKGKGGVLKNSAATKTMVFAGASAMEGEDSEFAVAGDNTAVTNFMRDVTDGKGRTSFAKEGAGTWVLGGETSFSGSLSVRGGTLLVPDPTKYTWFRWTIKENNSETGTHTEATELGIWDENGNRINGRLYPFTNYYKRVEGMLPEGMCSYWRGGTLQDWVSSSYRPIEALFDDGTPILSNRATYWMCTFHAGAVGKGYGLKPMLNVETNWLPIVMHLTNGTARAASFDVCPSSTTDRKYKAFSMEGSVDGIRWDLLTNVVLAAATANGKWTFSGGSHTAGSAKTHAGGAKIAGGPENAALALANVESVSVAAGARLVAWGGVAPIKGLTVDANGAGAIDGFGFAANGTLDIENMPAGGATLPGTYVNCTGLENVANWSISVGGKHTARYKTTYSGGVLRVTAIGTAISIR